jgi:glycosyltransferase involved in cell wall biosynthesis
MKVTLATGIYPPDIGGPATYVERLSRELSSQLKSLTVVTFSAGEDRVEEGGDWKVVRVSKGGGPLVRWSRYSAALREHAKGSDIVYAFSSVSAGVPVWMARIKHAKKILRLGGDFAWERYTDKGGDLSLTEWYESKPRFQGLMNGMLNTFDHIVFSTEFQEHLYERFYQRLPLHSVIENAVPGGRPTEHEARSPFRLLFLGRFVAFKNLGALLKALPEVPEALLTIVGEGPMESALREQVKEEGLSDRVSFRPVMTGSEKRDLFDEHDLLLLPSLTELSPNAALEARAAGLPVLLTEQTGLSTALTDGAMLRPLRTPREIAQGIREAMTGYEALAARAASAIPERLWSTVASEHLTLFRSLL